MPKPHIALVTALALLTLAAVPACSDKSEAPDARGSTGAAAQATAPGSSPDMPAASRAMRVTVEMAIVSGDVDGAVNTIRAAVREEGGYVADAQTKGETKHRSADLELKVPLVKLDDFRAAIAGTGTITRQSEKAEDVTEQRADLKARVRNAHAEEKRLIDLLSDRTGTLADVIAAEKSLAEVREKIERLEAQDSTLDGQVAFATIRVHVSPTLPAEPAGAPAKIIAAAEKGVNLLGEALVGGAIAIATLGPIGLVLALIAYALYRILKVLNRAKPQQPPAVRAPWPQQPSL